MKQQDNIEHEGKILNIDEPATIKKLLAVGFEKVGDFNFRRYVFDTLDGSKNKWVRLRTDGKTTTLTVKEITSDAIDGTHEWEVAVDNFQTTFEILRKIGLSPKGYQENQRQEYRRKAVSVSIDKWPHLPTYIEIEAAHVNQVRQVADELGFDSKDLTGLNTKGLYREIDIDLDNYPVLSFKENK